MADFPNESAAYRAARDELLAAEARLRTLHEDVAELRRALPAGGVLSSDYVFTESGGGGQAREVRLSELFGPHDALFVYHFMYGPEMARPCPLCSALLDALDAQMEHLSQQVAVVVVARSPIERLQEVARTRGWSRLRLVSAAANDFPRDYRSEDEQGNQWPMANVFRREPDGTLRHHWGSELLFHGFDRGDPRHVDAIWPLWNVLDLTHAGRGTDWYPALEYPETETG